MKRIKLTHGTAIVEEDCPQETIDALNEMVNLIIKSNDTTRKSN